MPTIPDPCIVYVERPPDPPAGYLTAALRRIAAATYAEADEVDRLRATAERLEAENGALRDRVAELEGPFGTPVVVPA